LATLTPGLDVSVSAIVQAWRARFVENGVPLDDYERTCARIVSWADWCAEWEQTAAEHEAEACAAERQGRHLTAAELWLLAALAHHYAKFLFVHDTDQLRRAQARAVGAYRHAAPHLPWPCERVGIGYLGTTLPGYLRLPDVPHGNEPAGGAAGDAPWPVVIVVPGLDATKEEMHRFQEVFLRRGMATLSFDGPGQGEVEFDLPIQPDWEVVASAAVDELEMRPEIDSSRVGVAGVSLGGYYAARAAIGEPRVTAAACLGGCYSLGDCWAELPPLSRQAFAMRSHSADMAAAETYARRITMDSAPGPFVRPMLVVHGRQDRLFGEDQARRLADRAGHHGTLVMEDNGDHVCHSLAYRVRPMIADWMADQLRLRGA